MKSVWKEMADRQFAEGFEHGGESALESAALRMLKAGKLAFNEIAEYLGLPLAKVKELAASLA